MTERERSEEETPLLSLRKVTRRYDSGGVPVDVLRGVDLEVHCGESVAIVGPSGSGKSTLLNIMGTLDQPTEGTLLFEGRDLVQMPTTELSRFRNREVGFVFQQHCLLPQCSVLENVLVPTLVHPDAGGAQDRAVRLLERVGLGDRLQNRPGQLSGGECQRVAVVRALINTPRLLLADEPTGSLDRAASESLSELLLELNREQNVSLVVVTHAESLAEKMQSVRHLQDGELRAECI